MSFRIPAGYSSSPLRLDSPPTLAFTVHTNRSRTQRGGGLSRTHTVEEHTHPSESSPSTSLEPIQYDTHLVPGRNEGEDDGEGGEDRSNIGTLPPTRSPPSTAQGYPDKAMKCPLSDTPTITTPVSVLYGRSMPNLGHNMSMSVYVGNTASNTRKAHKQRGRREDRCSAWPWSEHDGVLVPVSGVLSIYMRVHHTFDLHLTYYFLLLLHTFSGGDILRKCLLSCRYEMSQNDYAYHHWEECTPRDDHTYSFNTSKALVPRSSSGHVTTHSAAHTTHQFVDPLHGSSVFITHIAHGRSFALELPPEDFSPLPRLTRSSSQYLSPPRQHVLEEFCAPRNEETSFIYRDTGRRTEDNESLHCPANESNSLSRPPSPSVHSPLPPTASYLHDAALLGGVLYQMSTVMEAVMRGDSVFQISLLVLSLLIEILRTTLWVIALVGICVIGIAWLLGREEWIWSGMRYTLQRLMVVVEGPHTSPLSRPSEATPASTSSNSGKKVYVTTSGGSEESGGGKDTRLNQLVIFDKEELGRGSNGTVVLRGLLEGKRHVAVKKMLSRFQSTIDRCVDSFDMICN